MIKTKYMFFEAKAKDLAKDRTSCPRDALWPRGLH